MSRRLWWFTLGLAGVWALGIAIIQWIKFHAFAYNGLDLGIYQQAVWSLAHGHGFASSIHDPSYLGDHLELWLLPVAGLYRFIQSPFTLLWTQTFILALSIIPLAQIARQYLSPRGTVVAVILYALHPLLYNVALYEFHGLVFALPLILWSIVAYQRGQRSLWIIFLLLTLTVREDMPLLVLGWSLFASLDRRGWRWWLGPAAAAVVWFVVAQRVIGAHDFVAGYKFLAFYQWMGNSYVEMATFPFRHPIVFIENILGLRNWTTVLGFLAGFGFLPLFRPKYLWPLAFAFANLLVLHGEPISFLHLHYVIPYLPFLAWASLVVVRDMRDRKIWPRWDQDLVRPLLGISIVLAPLYSHVLYGVAEMPWRSWPDIGITSPAVLRAALQRVSPTDRVLTTFNLLPNVSDRQSVYSLNYVYLGRRQYSQVPYTVPTPIDVAVIDWQQLMHYQFLYTDTLFQGRTGSERIRDLLAQNGLRATWWHDSVVVYEKNTWGEYSLTDEAIGSAESKLIGPLTLTNQDNDAFVTPGTVTGVRERGVDFFWHVNEQSPHPLFIRFTLQHDGKTAWTSTRLLGQGGYPADEWPKGSDWQTNYQLAFPDSLQGTYSLKAEILNLEAGYRLDRWRQFLPSITRQTPLGSIDLGQISL